MTDDDAPALRLLIVEDEAMVAMLIEDAVALHGHHVVGVADSREQALRLAEAGRPDMALCDVQLLDRADGPDIAEDLAARGVICLFLSGQCPAGAAHPLIVGCLAKPFHTAGIGRAIRSAYEAAQGRRPAALPAGMTLY